MSQEQKTGVDEEDEVDEELDEGNINKKLPKPMRTAKVITDEEIEKMISDG